MKTKTEPKKWLYQAVVVEVKDGDTISYNINLASFNQLHEVKPEAEMIDLGFSVSVSQDFLPYLLTGSQLWLKNKSIRLFGLNAPEKNTDSGKEVANYVRDLLPVDAVIILETIRVRSKTKQDKYGRYLGRIILPDSRCLNDMLLEQKLAVPMLF
jgi:endonuclease YncB( thermonuclease family)